MVHGGMVYTERAEMAADKICVVDFKTEHPVSNACAVFFASLLCFLLYWCRMFFT